MKILQFLLSPRIGGAETLAKSLQSEWAKTGIESEIAYVDPSNGTGFKYYSRPRHIRSAYNRCSPNVVVTHSAIPNAYCRLALPRSVPIVPVMHSAAGDFDFRSLRTAEYFLQYWRNDHVVAVSSQLKAQYVNLFGDRTPVHLIQNGIADPGYFPSPNLGAPNLVTLARVTSAKNPWLWHEVANHFASIDSQATFDWIGPMDHDPEIQAIADSINTSDHRGRLLGGAPDGASLLRKYNIYFHPSDREAHSLSILEAVMTGLPVVCSDTVANSVGIDLVSETFDVGNPTSAIRAVTSAIEKYASHVERAEPRRRLVVERFGIAHTADSYVNLFRKHVIQ
ncbi:glycosyltransferase family 4 protein [Kocuria sp. CPCC 205258]|uniref:glycosyltransferase family 4 protein n=1 Tax=Kocuria sp. CPCC 205258 TaxID=3073552 RepID=UPI0034D6C6AD